MSRGRPVKGAKLVEDLEGSRDAKKRLKVILEAISGKKSVSEACAELGIGKSAFHELRTRTLQATLENLEPKPAGRPRMEVTEEQAEIERLKREKKELLTELEIAHVREEIMLAMPEVFEPAKKAAEKKTMRASEKKKQQEKRRKRKKRKQMRKRSRRR
jgi:transposase-like protein